MNDNIRKKDRDRKRVAYWFQKCVAVGLIPHTLDEEDKLRAMFKEWKEAQGKPIIPDENTGENEPLESTQGTTVSEFYRVKRAHELDKDAKWNKELRNIREAEKGGSFSERSERLRWGESPLIFDITTTKTKTFSMGSDSDKFIRFRRKKDKEKEKSSWFFNQKIRPR